MFELTNARAVFALLCIPFAFGSASAQEGPLLDAETIQKLEAQGYETSPEVFQELVTGGQPNGRWKEGLTLEGIEPMPWLSSAANWVPGKEEAQPEEIRITFMGSSPLPRPGQMGHFGFC